MAFVLNYTIHWISQFGPQEDLKTKLLVGQSLKGRIRRIIRIIYVVGAVVQPLPNSYSIFRAPSQASGMCWLDALEISLRNDSALIRSISTKSTCGSTSHETQWSEADYERHFVHGT